MLRRTNIGWADYSGGNLNFVIGCTPVSEGCAHCYAKTWADRIDRDFSDIQIYRDKLSQLYNTRWSPGDVPYRRGPGSRPILFPCDLSDLFHPEVEDNFILIALDVFADRDDGDWVLLTKRPHRMLQITDYWLRLNELKQLPDNIWCMATVENQKWADIRIPLLLQVKAQVLGMSLEPMLEPIDLFSVDGKIAQSMPERSMLFPVDVIDWVIVGAESGPSRRPFDVAWAKDVYEQCAAAGVPFFGKQDSGFKPGVPLFIGGKEIKEFPQ